MSDFGKFSSWTLALLMLVAGCHKVSNQAASREAEVRKISAKTLVNQYSKKPRSENPVTVREVSYDPQNKLVKVSGGHGGGCGEHEFSVEVAQNPKKANNFHVEVIDDTNDKCEAWINYFAEFSLEDFGFVKASGQTLVFRNGPYLKLPSN